MDYLPDCVLQVVVELERCEKQFYESFAESCVNSRTAALAASLANAEAQHISVIRQMRNVLPFFPGEVKLTEEEIVAARELGTVKLPDSYMVRMAIQADDLCTALDMAITMENRLTVCYAVLAKRITGPDAATMNRLAGEEKEHQKFLVEHRQRFFSRKEYVVSSFKLKDDSGISDIQYVLTE